MSLSLDDTICAYFVDNTKVTGAAKAGKVSTAGATGLEFNSAEQLGEALAIMRKHLDDSRIREIKPSEGYTLIASGGLSKKDVFVLARFEGDFFEQLQMSKALVVGAPCILECLTNMEPVPLGKSAIYTTAMRGLHISATGISSEEKVQLSKLVHWMGGHYFQNFGRSITHLISNTIKSSKYEHATLNNVPVMHTDWVQRVWERSTAECSVRATDTEFDKYRLPTFFGANITCSGLDAACKEKVMCAVNENGGIYHRAFRSQLVDIVITEQSKTDTEKYKAAVRFKKDVLLPAWIFDSCERGYALPTKAYEVRASKQISTPTKQRNNDQTVADQTQLSELSRISFVSDNARRMCSDQTTINETLSSVAARSPPVASNKNTAAPAKSAKQLLKQATSSAQHYQQTLAEICPRQAKQAGSFLDGCCVYLSGFRTEEREKLHRVLNTGGATRYDEANEGITHIIVGQLEDVAYRQWQRDGLLGAVHIVRLDWLLECIKAAHIVSELVYRVSLPQLQEPDAASPASKRTLRSMNHSFKQPQLPMKKNLFDTKADNADEADEQLLTHYSQEHEPAATLPPVNESSEVTMEPAASSTQLGVEPTRPQPQAPAMPMAMADLSASMLSIDFDKLNYFHGASVYVHKASFNDEFYAQMLTECEAAQGNLVSQHFCDPVDYAIVSFEVAFDMRTLPVQARHVVTELYMESCMKQNKLLPLEYFHRPVPIGASQEPLRGMTIVVSIYNNLERDYINSTAALLGASVNKTFIKKEKPLLVCPHAEGSKYEGAIKWRYPVVHAGWLVQCAERGLKVPYVDFLVGASATDFPNSPLHRQPNSKTPSTSGSSKTLTLNAVDNTQHAEELENQHVPAPPTADFTPLRNKRVSELARTNRTNASSSGQQDATDSPRTPLSQIGAAGYNFDFLEQFVQRLDTDEARDCVREIIREMRENQTPELERIRRQAATPVNRRALRPAPAIPDFCLTPEYQQRMADDFERRWRLPKEKITPDTPIAEIRQRVMRITCETLGIRYESSDDDHQTRARSAAKASKPTTPRQSSTRSTIGRTLFEKTPGTPAAGHSVLETESHFVPCTQSPQQEHERPLQRTGVESKQLGRTTINFDKISFEESTAARASTLATSSPELKQITEYLKHCESRRNSLKRTHAHAERPAPAGGDDNYMESEMQFVQPFESEGYMLGTEEDVGWRDPAEFNAAKRRSNGGSPRMQHTGMPCFSISCSDEQRPDIIDKIRKLNGKVCENLINFDASCTHFVCERPNRGEKMLGSMAAGKWILHTKYVEESSARGYFIDEELYEWGNSKALQLPTLSAEEQVIATAAHRWRTQLNHESGVFTDHRVILSLHERSRDAIRNVLHAGAGIVLEPRSPFSTDAAAATATHCFVDVKRAPLAPHDFAYLTQCGVKVMSQMCINSYLMGGRDANLERYVLQK